MLARTACVLLLAGFLPALGLAQDGSIEPTKENKTQKGELPSGEGWVRVKTRFRAAPKFPYETPAVSARACVKDVISLPGSKTLTLHTKGSDRVGVDLNGDGVADVWGRGEQVTFTVPLLIEGKRVPYAVHLMQDGAKWSSRRGCYRTARFKGTPIVLIDDNSDGYFDGFGSDAMIVGRSRYASYLSNVLSIKGKLYQLRINRAGTQIALKPWTGTTGKIDLISGFKAGGRLAAVVIKDGDKSFNAVTKGLTVPAGTYTLSWGKVVKGKKRAKIEASIAVTVEAGKTATLKWGHPFTLDFSATRQGKRVTVGVSGISITGRAGERYSLFSPSSFTPYVRIRNKSTRLPLASGQMSLG